MCVVVCAMQSGVLAIVLAIVLALAPTVTHLFKLKLHWLAIPQAAKRVVFDNNVGLMHKHIGGAIIRGDKAKTWAIVEGRESRVAVVMGPLATDALAPSILCKHPTFCAVEPFASARNTICVLQQRRARGKLADSWEQPLCNCTSEQTRHFACCLVLKNYL